MYRQRFRNQTGTIFIDFKQTTILIIRILFHRPAYGPEVFQFMRGTKTKCVEYKFYEARISLSELLTIDDSRLQQIGIEFPFQRKRILLGLLKFHEQAWAKTSLQIPNRINNNVRECFYVYANCLRQLVTLKSSLHFIENHELFKDVEMTAPAYEYRQEINELFVSIHLKTKNLLKTLRQVKFQFNCVYFILTFSSSFC